MRIMRYCQAVILFAASALLTTTVRSAEVQAGSSGEVYTLVNLWVEQQKPIPTTNYHKGEIIPLGSKVTAVSADDKTISFVFKGQTLTIQKTKHTHAGMDAVKARTFGASDPLTSDAFKALPEAQRNAVKSGQVIAGMTKAAVLMAYGYPPEHKTPSTEGNCWLYWRDKFRTQSVTFTEGKVSATTGF